MIDNLFLDMDGCCVDFLKGALELLGVKLTSEQQLQLNQEYTFWKDLATDFSAIDGLIKSQDLRNLVHDAGEDFWANLSRCPANPIHLVERFISQTGAKLTIVTNPSDFIGAYAGKLRWLDHHLTVPYSTVFTKDKYLLAGTPNSLLIDDHYPVVSAFSNAGGRVFLYNGYLESSRTHLTFLLDHEKRTQPKSFGTS